jgi:hypothetical protein
MCRGKWASFSKAIALANNSQNRTEQYSVFVSYSNQRASPSTCFTTPFLRSLTPLRGRKTATPYVSQLYEHLRRLLFPLEPHAKRRIRVRLARCRHRPAAVVLHSCNPPEVVGPPLNPHQICLSHKLNFPNYALIRGGRSPLTPLVRRVLPLSVQLSINRLFTRNNADSLSILLSPT